MNYTSPYLGKHIEEMIYEKKLTVSQFAKQLGVSANSIYELFKRHDIEVKLLRKISEVLEHDFFRYYLAEPAPTQTQLKETLQTTQKELETLKKQTQALQNENTYLKEINLMLKDKTGK